MNAHFWQIGAITGAINGIFTGGITGAVVGAVVGLIGYWIFGKILKLFKIGAVLT